MGGRIHAQSRFLLAIACLIAACCGEDRTTGEASPARQDDARLLVYVVNYPLKYFAERIGNELVQVELPVPPGVDPAFWRPGPEFVAAYQKADLIFLNGAGYARWIDRVSLPASKLVDTSRAFKDQYIPIEDALTHQHGPKGGRAHAGTAFTTWIDPKLAIAQARAIKETFVARRPDQKDVFEEGFGSLERDLRALDRALGQVVSKDPGRPLLASHPVYQYLAKRYVLNLESIHWEPEQSPGEKMWRALEDLLVSHPAKQMIWEGTPREETKARLVSLGIETVVFTPCGSVPEEGDYLSVMRRNVRNLASAYRD